MGNSGTAQVKYSLMLLCNRMLRIPALKYDCLNRCLHVDIICYTFVYYNYIYDMLELL